MLPLFSKILAVGLWLPLIIWAVGDSALRVFRPPRPYIFTPGVTFSDVQAEALGLDKREAYTAVLDNLGARKLRLIAYWDRVEPSRGQFDFSELDWEIYQAGSREAKVILALGQKLPRWPECHTPRFAREFLISNSLISKNEFENALLTYVRAVVERYKGSPAVEMWQIENEPFFKFGVCPDIPKQLVTKEVELVRSLDKRPIVITDSGELGTWFEAARIGDIVGTTMYRTTWKKGIGYLHYFLPASFYETKAKLINFLFKTPVVVAEMQAEPWAPAANLREVPIDEQFKSMSFEKFKEAVSDRRAIQIHELRKVQRSCILRSRKPPLARIFLGRGMVVLDAAERIPRVLGVYTR